LLSWPQVSWRMLMAPTHHAGLHQVKSPKTYTLLLFC
jgi:hypothetical protein